MAIEAAVAVTDDMDIVTVTVRPWYLIVTQFNLSPPEREEACGQILNPWPSNSGYILAVVSITTPSIFSIWCLTPPNSPWGGYFVSSHQLSPCDVYTLASTWTALVPELSI